MHVALAAAAEPFAAATKPFAAEPVAAAAKPFAAAAKPFSAAASLATSSLAAAQTAHPPEPARECPCLQQRLSWGRNWHWACSVHDRFPTGLVCGHAPPDTAILQRTGVDVHRCGRGA